MKSYMKLLWIAVVCGVLNIYCGILDHTSISLSSIVFAMGFGEVIYYPNQISEVMYWYVPLSLKNPGQDVHPVLLLPGGRIPGLSRLPAVQVLLNHLLRQGKSCRAAVHHCTDALSMGFPPGGHLKIFSKY